MERIQGAENRLQRIHADYPSQKYLYAFFFFNSGVQTVMLLATIFASKAIDWPQDEGTTGLIIAILLIQILAAIGAKLMSNISIKIGNISTLKFPFLFGYFYVLEPTLLPHQQSFTF